MECSQEKTTLSSGKSELQMFSAISGRHVGKLLNKQGPLDKQQRREAGSFIDQDQQYFLIKRKTKCKADRTAQRVILMPNISVSHY